MGKDGLSKFNLAVINGPTKISKQANTEQLLNGYTVQSALDQRLLQGVFGKETAPDDVDAVLQGFRYGRDIEMS